MKDKLKRIEGWLTPNNSPLKLPNWRKLKWTKNFTPPTQSLKEKE